MLVDSHCHLEYDSYIAEGDAPIERARAAGVGACVTIGTKLATFEKTLAVAERFDAVWCSVGVHPDAAELEPLTDAAVLIEHTRHPKVIGIGETALDYHYETPSQAAQATNFLVHIDAAQETRLPLVIHTRDAEDDTIAMLEEKMKRTPFTGVLHCFSGTAKLAEAGLRLGLPGDAHNASQRSVSGHRCPREGDTGRGRVRPLFTTDLLPSKIRRV